MTRNITQCPLMTQSGHSSFHFALSSPLGLFGFWIIGTAIWHALHGTLPNAFTMGAIGFAALAANAISSVLLWAYREGDANILAQSRHRAHRD